MEIKLPGLDCGICGYATCAEFAKKIKTAPELIKRCIHLDAKASISSQAKIKQEVKTSLCSCSGVSNPSAANGKREWIDSLGREFDFILNHFPEEPGPREIVLPHNPMLTRELEIKKGDVMIGRPLGMSCGCPVTHCGEVMDVDMKTGVIVWCVTGPLRPRLEGFKDIGYYSAEAYEGLITESRCEIKIGMRYFFQPEMCMLQWRHSGLVNYLNRTAKGLQVRVEGLWIG